MARRNMSIPIAQPYDPFAPISKDEALEKARGHDGFYRDGYDGGAELPSDSDTIDPLIFPQREAPRDDFQRQWDQKKAKDCEVIEEAECDRFTQSRDFSIDMDRATGKKGA